MIYHLALKKVSQISMLMILAFLPQGIPWSNDLKILEENANQDLQHVCSWLLANKLSINTLKCKYIIIGSQYNLSRENYVPDIKILGKSVKRVYEFDQLGVTIDDKLNWSRHIEKLYKKLSWHYFV